MNYVGTVEYIKYSKNGVEFRLKNQNKLSIQNV